MALPLLFCKVKAGVLPETTWINFLFSGLWEGPKASCNNSLGLSPQEVVLKRKKTVGTVMREIMEKGYRGEKDIEGFHRVLRHTPGVSNMPYV